MRHPHLPEYEVFLNATTIMRPVHSQPAANPDQLSGTTPRIVPMEGIRGFAILLIFFVHSDGVFGMYLSPDGALSHSLALLGRIGHSGVDLFFILSGYLIYRSLFHSHPSYRDFIERRLSRIYPAFLTVLGVYLGLSMLLPAESKIHGSPTSACIYIVQNVFLLPGIFSIRPIVTVAWSLSFEFLFYLIAPLFLQLFSLRKRSLGMRIAVLSAVLFGYLALCVPFSMLRPRMAGFIFGMLLYELSRSSRFLRHLSRVGELGVILLWLCSMAAFVWVRAQAPSGALLGLPMPLAPLGVAIVDCACFVLVLYSCHFSGVLCHIFSCKPLRQLGAISYSYYLIHGLTLKAVAALLGAFAIKRVCAPVFTFALLPGAFVVTLVMARVLFVCVETRFRSFSLSGPRIAAGITAKS